MFVCLFVPSSQTLEWISSVCLWRVYGYCLQDDGLDSTGFLFIIVVKSTCDFTQNGDIPDNQPPSVVLSSGLPLATNAVSASSLLVCFKIVRQSVECCCFWLSLQLRKLSNWTRPRVSRAEKQTSAPVSSRQKTLLRHFRGHVVQVSEASGWTSPLNLSVRWTVEKNEMMRKNKMPSAVTIVVWIICITKIHLIEYFWKLFRAVNYIRLLFCFYFCVLSFFSGFAVATSAHKRLNLEQIYWYSEYINNCYFRRACDLWGRGALGRGGRVGSRGMGSSCVFK